MGEQGGLIEFHILKVQTPIFQQPKAQAVGFENTDNLVKSNSITLDFYRTYIQRNRPSREVLKSDLPTREIGTRVSSLIFCRSPPTENTRRHFECKRLPG